MSVVATQWQQHSYYHHCNCTPCHLCSLYRFQPHNLLFLHPNPSLPLTSFLVLSKAGHLYLDLANPAISAWFCQTSSDLYRHVHKFLRRLMLPKPEPPLTLPSHWVLCSKPLDTSSCCRNFRMYTESVSLVYQCPAAATYLKIRSARQQSKHQGGHDMNQ